MNKNALRIRALERALEICKQERYNHIGNPDPKPLEDFDADLKRIKDAISYYRKANITPWRW
jgi:hypothetical protein